MPVMKCPKCDQLQTKLIDGARNRNGKQYRRRKCLKCGYKFNTIEVYSKQTLEDAKNDKI